MDPISIASLLDRTYPGRSGDKPMVQTFSWWDTTVPPRIADRARPVSLKHGTLVVHTGSSAWAQELSFHERDLLASVQRTVPAVRRLRIRVGPMPRRPDPPEAPPPKVQPIPLSHLPPELARGLAMLADDDVRDAVALAARTSLAPTPPRPPRKTPRKPPRT